jgi:hypothetical protein
MSALHNVGAVASGPVTPTSDEAPAGGAAQGFKIESSNLHSASASQSMHALRVIEGEEYARAYIDRLQAGIASRGELAVILAFLDGEMLHGACRVIEKALGAHNA